MKFSGLESLGLALILLTPRSQTNPLYKARTRLHCPALTTDLSIRYFSLPSPPKMLCFWWPASSSGGGARGGGGSYDVAILLVVVSVVVMVVL